MKELLRFLKCISDETRLKILMLLLEQKLCVCELTEVLEKSQPCISQHLRRFKELDLVVEERIEQWSYFSINQVMYRSYLEKLNTLGGTCLGSLGVEELDQRLKVVKEQDLCNLKNKCGRGNHESK